ncbi:MAG: hypothetical protein WD906_00095 [Anaerolineales bacterium]
MCLHTILIDPANPQRMYIAISAAGAFRTDDGGDSWKPINRGLKSEYIPDPEADVGPCVHRLAMQPSQPNVLYMQKHWDVLRTDDAGRPTARCGSSAAAAAGMSGRRSRSACRRGTATSTCCGML